MLTPQEVSSKTFPKAVMGGYAMAAVDEFLDALTEDYTNLYKETAALKTKVKTMMEQMEEYRQVEDAMRSTLLAAQRTAKEIVSEAEQKRDALTAEVEERKQSLVSGAETAARERVAQLEAQMAEEEQKLADTRERVAGEIAAQARKLEKAKPVLTRLPGWKCDIRGIRKYEELPENCRKYVEFVEQHIGYPITMISNGPGRDDIIYRESPLKK